MSPAVLATLRAVPSAHTRKGDPILKAENIEVTYKSARGNITALEGFSTSTWAGEFVSILGPSGCGKSTLLRIVSGLMPPTKGQMSLAGDLITGPRRDVGIVFQQPTLLPWKNVLENVMLPVRTLGLNIEEGRKKSLELLRLVGLEKFVNHYPTELSGGMQQRVSIARSLVHDPSVLLMDEPFAALDAMTREHMSKELQRIWMATNKTIVFITHSIPEAVFLSDRVLVLSARPGTLVQEFEIDLPRPRTTETMASKEFANYTGELRALFERLVKFD